MVFSSITFLLFFLPLTLAGYFSIGRRHGNAFLLAASLLFYFWGEGWLVGALLFSVAAVYALALSMDNARIAAGNDPASARKSLNHKRKLLLITSLAINLGLLCYFKYANFFVEDILRDGAGVGGEYFAGWQKIALPLGISFYTFQSMSYVIDVYRGVVPASRRFIDFACYVTCFPQLVAGPIVRYRDIVAQLRGRVVDSAMFAGGVRRFIIGLAKKTLIANTVAQTADAIFAMAPQSLDAAHAWLGVACYTLQIYYDFSGYSDMAIGLGMMFGFRFPENFNHPYSSASIREFWRRWHITLSTWLRDYLYIPLGGNRVAPWRAHINLWIVFLLCGLWHGASWNFVAWGAYHGLFLVLERLWLARMIEAAPALLRHVYAMLVVMLGWVIFRSDTLDQAWLMSRAMFGFGSAHDDAVMITYYMQNDIIVAMIAGVAFSFPLVSWLKKRESISCLLENEFINLFGLAGVLILSIAVLSSASHNPFLYFRF